MNHTNSNTTVNDATIGDVFGKEKHNVTFDVVFNGYSFASKSFETLTAAREYLFGEGREICERFPSAFPIRIEQVITKRIQTIYQLSQNQYNNETSNPNQ